MQDAFQLSQALGDLIKQELDPAYDLRFMC